MVDILPGINEKEWAEFEKKFFVAAPLVPWLHIDIADETIIPARTLLDFTQLPGLLTQAAPSLEGHLMVAKPELYIQPLVTAGFKRLIAHVECEDPRLFLDEAQYENLEVGLAIDAPTEIEVIEPYLEQIDVVLVMMAEAGPSGMPLQLENVEKVRAIRAHYPDLPIEVDDGINDETAVVVRDAGATRLVSTSYLFSHIDTFGESLERLRNI